MATRSPFPFLDELLTQAGRALRPPDWLVSEAQRRLVLLLNHVLMQEPEAQARLARQSGRVVEARWRAFVVRLLVTPAGLLDLDTGAAVPDLTLTVTEASFWNLGQAALRGDKPPVQIAGDVQLAAEINWLVDNVRWDLEEDLSRLIGDAPAHTVGRAARAMADALRRFIGAAGRSASTGASAEPVSPASTAPMTARPPGGGPA